MGYFVSGSLWLFLDTWFCSILARSSWFEYFGSDGDIDVFQGFVLFYAVMTLVYVSGLRDLSWIHVSGCKDVLLLWASLVTFF
jgi:hypothetical protein